LATKVDFYHGLWVNGFFVQGQQIEETKYADISVREGAFGNRPYGGTTYLKFGDLFSYKKTKKNYYPPNFE
jgi:hypothetical protein